MARKKMPEESDTELPEQYGSEDQAVEVPVPEQEPDEFSDRTMADMIEEMDALDAQIKDIREMRTRRYKLRKAIMARLKSKG